MKTGGQPACVLRARALGKGKPVLDLRARRQHGDKPMLRIKRTGARKEPVQHINLHVRQERAQTYPFQRLGDEKIRAARFGEHRRDFLHAKPVSIGFDASGGFRRACFLCDAPVIFRDRAQIDGQAAAARRQGQRGIYVDGREAQYISSGRWSWAM